MRSRPPSDLPAGGGAPRRREVRVGVALLSIFLAACRSSGPDPGRRIERALASATGALIAAQDPDGAWRSRTYGGLKDGLALSPPILKAVTFGPDVAGADRARRRGASFLAAQVQGDGTISSAGPYPVYAAATAIIVLARVPVAGGPAARDAWLRALRQGQLTEALGWGPTDPPYGGWGDSFQPSAKPDAGRPPARPAAADLSSTLFAVGALRLAGVAADDPAIVKALQFVVRCQNIPEDVSDVDPAFDDGGFFFSPTVVIRNKAGAAGTDRRGCRRYHSYGSATADGLRALLRCGLTPDHPRVRAARSWLERHFSVATNPGTFEPGREIEGQSTYFYYCWSLAHAFRALGLRRIPTPGGMVSWAEDLSAELIRRQRADGTWRNRSTAAKEDDPLVATALAAGALGACRMGLAP